MRAVSLSEEKIRIVENRENSLRFHEKDLEFKAVELDEREESVMAREQDYNQLVDDVQSKAFKFCKEYCCVHKVLMILVFVMNISFCFRIARLGMQLIVARSLSQIYEGMKTSWLDIL